MTTCCEETCSYASDGDCDDGNPGSEWFECTGGRHRLHGLWVALCITTTSVSARTTSSLFTLTGLCTAADQSGDTAGTAGGSGPDCGRAAIASNIDANNDTTQRHLCN